MKKVEGTPRRTPSSREAAERAIGLSKKRGTWIDNLKREEIEADNSSHHIHHDLDVDERA
ncbi:MAG TPA: hypothetical protein VGY99_22165 [Candidatus Binataceae bacterium]|jgi:hypothetical protein|nr:hypothetical protein [Candidatus Binataceae bacterium]